MTTMCDPARQDPRGPRSIMDQIVDEIRRLTDEPVAYRISTDCVRIFIDIGVRNYTLDRNDIATLAKLEGMNVEWPFREYAKRFEKKAKSK